MRHVNHSSIKLYSRADWHARQPRAMAVQGSFTEAFIHHSDDTNAARLLNFNAQAAKMRQIQDYHMDTKGWSDIAYHFVVFQPYGVLVRARIFEGRRLTAVPAAQEGHNSNTLAICVVGDYQSLNEVKRNTRYAIEQLLSEFPELGTLGGHRDVVSTTCPGDRLYREIPRIAGAVDLSVYKR